MGVPKKSLCLKTYEFAVTPLVLTPFVPFRPICRTCEGGWGLFGALSHTVASHNFDSQPITLRVSNPNPRAIPHAHFNIPIWKLKFPRGWAHFPRLNFSRTGRNHVLSLFASGGTPKSPDSGDSKNTVRGYCLDIPRFEESLNDRKKCQNNCSRNTVSDSKKG